MARGLVNEDKRIRELGEKYHGCRSYNEGSYRDDKIRPFFEYLMYQIYSRDPKRPDIVSANLTGGWKNAPMFTDLKAGAVWIYGYAHKRGVVVYQRLGPVW